MIQWRMLCTLITAVLWSICVQIYGLKPFNNEFARIFLDDLISQYSSNRTLTLDQFRQFLENVYTTKVLDESTITTWPDDVNKLQSNYCASHLAVDIEKLAEESFCNVSYQCLNAETVPSWSPFLGSEIGSQDLLSLCPLILYQIDRKTCSHIIEEKTSRPSTLEVWGYGFLFVTLISLCSLVGVSFIPFMGKNLYNKLLMFLVGLAVGSLCGSAIFHLIPQAFHLINGDNHDYLWRAIVVVGGIYLFFITERLMKIILESKKRKKVQMKKEFSETNTLDDIPTEAQITSIEALENGHLNRRASSPIPPPTFLDITEEVHATCKHDHLDFKSGGNVIATVAWMIVFGDGLHNFIDGLSIGAAFSESVLTGISISVAVICEEFPHELGDFAILLNAGMTMRQAMLYNFLSACTCYLGLITGILLGELTSSSTYIFALAAGMFLYISLVDMMPEMNQIAENASKASSIKALKILLIQSMGYLIGFATMFVLSLFGGKISFG